MPPANQEYMVAAYVVCAAILLGYAAFLTARVRKVPKREQGAGSRERE